MTKTHRQKQDRNPDYLSKNQGHAIKYRKRLQEDTEKDKEVKEFIKEEDAGKPIQDPVRTKYFQG